MPRKKTWGLLFPVVVTAICGGLFPFLFLLYQKAIPRGRRLVHLVFLLIFWAVWIPAVAIVYSLPLALQFPLFNIVLCFWSLLLTALLLYHPPADK